LLSAQSGALKKAWKIYEEFSSLYGSNKMIGAPTKTVLRHFRKVLVEAEAYRHVSHPVSATSSEGGHHGFIARAEHFRFKSKDMIQQK